MQKLIMKRPNRAILTLAMVFFTSITSAQAQSLHDIPSIIVYEDMGIPAPTTVFYNNKGEETTLQDLKGTPLIVNFWATWCPPCVKEMPGLIALEKIIQPINGTRLITVSEDFGGISAVESYISKKNLDIKTPYIDKKNALMNAFNIKANLPTTILINKNGTVIARINGTLDGSSPKIQAILQQNF